MNIRIYKDSVDACRMLAYRLKELVERHDGDFNLVLSGGSTPKLFFEILVSDFRDLAWEKVHFYWSDERCVPHQSEESNYGMTLKYLLSPLGISEQQIHPVSTDLVPAAAALDYEQTISQNLPFCCGLPKFDLVILGMGDDGHTASIFPDHLTLITSEKLCEVAIQPETKQVRVSLTGSLINNAENIVFLCTGATKAKRVFDVIVNDDPTLPASYIKVLDGTVDWFLDEAAASALKK